MKGFFSDNEKEFTYPKWTQRLYEKLSNALIARDIRKLHLPQKSTQAALVYLASIHGEDKVKAAIDWYCKHAGEKYVPQISSVASLKKKFRSVLDKVYVTPSSREITIHGQSLSETVRQIQEQTGGLIWPENEKVQEPIWIETCVCAYYDYKEALKKVARQESNQERKEVLEFLLEKESHIPTFVTHWIRESHRLYWNRFTLSSGNSASRLVNNLTLIPTPKNSRFQFYVLNWISQFTGKQRATSFYYSIRNKIQ